MTDPTSSSTPPPAIQTFDLTKQYGAKRGIRNVSMRIERGEIFGFLGPNGAGKSTTLRTLLGYLRPTSGRADILGLDVTTRSVAIHRRLGNLPSEFNLEDRMTGHELLRYFAELRDSGPASIAHGEALAARLDASLDVPMRRLSRGNKQKIGIIQALFHQPEVVILDEPTTGLDPLVRDEFVSLIRDVRDAGATVLFSSHVLPEVEQVADRVGIIRDGELVAVEEPDALLGRAVRYVRAQFAEDAPATLLTSLERVPGVSTVERTGTTVTCTATGAMDDVLKLVSRYPVVQFDAERPPLEELFLQFYGPSMDGAS